MRRSRTAKTSDKSTEEPLRHALEEAGWRYTRQRAAVYDYLRSVDAHPTAEQVYQSVRRVIDNISLATVYKALEALVEVRLASKLADADGPARYDCRSEHHYHIRCLETGEVRDLPLPYDSELPLKLDPGLLDALRKEGFEVTGHRLELVGHYVDR